MANKPLNRVPLRQLMAHAEKLSRDLIDLLQTALLANLTDLRDLTRLVRRRSHYPTMLAVRNALNKLQQSGQETNSQVDGLREYMAIILEQAKKERVNRY